MADTAAASAERPAVASRASSGRATRSSIPVTLNEAAVDSPTFRCAVVHFTDQIDAVERWLEGYVKATGKVAHDVMALEETIQSLLAKTVPSGISDALIDHDYTLLALKRLGDGQREWWNSLLGTMRKVEGTAIEPIRGFLNGDLRAFKETRRTLEQAQKTLDTTLARYVAQSKTKEPSSIREDAFTVYEARKAYLKASMDFCQMSAQLRYTLDQLLVRTSADVWREIKRARESALSSAAWGGEMERIRSWSKEMEASEAVFKRELQVARREIGEATLATYKPSRELDDYSASTVPFLGSRGPLNLQPEDKDAVISEKQGWLFLRTISGKPARVNWVHRWYYCRDGVFGWLMQGPQGVLQGDEIGVLLCSAKPAVQEERRFCFEIKTKSITLLLQAETQTQLIEWLEVFEVAKKRAFDASMSRDNGGLPGGPPGGPPGGIDPAFAITPPSIPEFSAKSLEAPEEGGLDRVGTLPVPGADGHLAARASFDVPRRSIATLGRDLSRELAREEGESGRDHAARIMQKLDLHRKATFTSSADFAAVPSPQPSAGIANLISATHSFLPVAYPPASPSASTLRVPLPALQAPTDPPVGNLAPLTLARPPVSTSMSKAAVVLTAERGIMTETGRGMPTAVVANYWGTSPWSSIYSTREEGNQFLRLDDEPFAIATTTTPQSSGESMASAVGGSHRKTMSDVTKMGEPRIQDKHVGETFPPRYPPELKAQHPQFRLLFPNVPLEEKLVLVFNAAWSSTTGQDSRTGTLSGSGRIYVSPDNMYFYGHQMGLVIAYTLSLDAITEVTAAPGKACDLIFLHLGQDMNNTGFARIAIKIFLEDLSLLHARLNLLVDDLQSEEPMDVPEIISALVNLESEEYDRKSPSVESWEEISSNTPVDDGTASGRPVPRRAYDHFGRDRSRRAGKPGPKVQLPTHPVVYEPEGMQRKVEERHFEISAKACFHVLFGDKSFIFPKLYFERHAKEIAQGPWELVDQGKMKRQFRFKVDVVDILGRKRPAEITDHQTIDVFSDHITYVVTHVKTAWHLPHSQGFRTVTKVVITHLAKSKCKLAIYTKVEWTKKPAFSKNLVQRQALDDVARDAQELAELATDQVRKLGPHSRTKRAIQVYGNIGQQTQAVLFTPGAAGSTGGVVAKKPPQVRPRTLTVMVFDTLRSFTESAATSILMWTFAAVRRLFKIVNAHRLLLLLLSLSILTNLVFTGRESSTWWSERRAAKFMGRIGVGPNVMMSKAVYLADLEEAANGPARTVLTPREGGECSDAFQQIMNATDMDAPYQEAGAALSSAASKATARRLRRTRQRLGSYRHDLLVAMRVVNSVEREVLQSEWENWLADENVRCEQVAVMLQEKGGGGGGGGGRNVVQSVQQGLGTGQGQQKVMRQVDEKRVEGLRRWHGEYCGSCRADQARLLEERRGAGVGE